MSLRFACDGCGKTLKAPDDCLGKEGKCPHCGHKGIVYDGLSFKPVRPAPVASPPVPPRLPVNPLPIPAERAFAFSITLSQVGPVYDPDWLGASDEVQDEVRRWIVVYGLKEKDADLAQGLDRNGQPLVPITEATRKNRMSAMGPADPDAPPLMPAYAVSRTRLLLEGEPTVAGAQFWWGNDPHSGGDWGKILDDHRQGIGKQKTVRDVIGISAAAVQRVRAQVLARWSLWKRAGLRAGWTPKWTPPAGPSRNPTLVVKGRTDWHNFTYGIGGTGAPRPGEQSTGVFFSRPGTGGGALGGPAPGPGRPFEPEPPIGPGNPWWRKPGPGPTKPPEDTKRPDDDSAK
jgi:hypothetical protein